MKTVLLIASLFCLVSTTQFIENFDSKKIHGSVVDEKGKPISALNVFIKNSRKGTQTDSAGYFEMIIPEKAMTLTLEHPLYKSKEVTIDDLDSNIIMEAATLKNKTLANNESKSTKIRGYSTDDRMEAAPVSRKPKHAPPAVRSKSFVDGEMMAEEVMITGSSIPSEIESRRIKKSDKTKTEKEAGQLTAGEWNDLSNWEAWEKLIKEDDYKEMGEYWKINAQDRVSVFVTNEFELPIPDCQVTLRSGGNIIWSSKTDNAGKAELWATSEMTDLSLEIASRENRRNIKEVKRISDGVNQISFKEECDSPRKAEIMFVVDATGSMGDEIEFLKSELSDVIDQVEGRRSNIDFKWGSVFYRDDSDHYLTRQTPLSGKTKRVLDFIEMQSAGGGGDYPEAVNEGLEEALMQEWSNDAITRIIFLVLDAPPHHDAQVLEDLKSQIAFASALGIKIIPITASGINRQTEYLMKFMSIMTNGTYVFLTDHSGIGGAHLDPIVKDYEVEKLNDLLIRLIQNYTDPGTCVRQEDNDPVFANVEVFPNPTVDMLQVKVPAGVQKISLTTSTGKLIHSEKITKQCDISLDLSAYVDGMYVINFFSEDKVHSVKVVKVNKA